MKIWKIFSLLFVVGVVSIVACAMISDDSSAEVTSGTTGDCTWTLDGTKLTISGNGAIADYEYSKPSPWGRSITEVIIENGVTSIGDGVFSGCKSLTSIIIPDSVTSIGNWASDRCISLTNVSIGNGVTSIGEEAFYSCESLTSITIPNSVTYIGESAFSGCTSFTSITIPYSDGKYTYTPWTTKDVIVSDESFTIIDSDIIFESTSFAVKYTFIVKYVDTDGKEIHPQYQGEARCEAIISPDIPSISGYRSPDERISIKITEDPSKNVVTYTYYLEDVETEGSSGFPMTSVVVGAIVAVIAIAAIAFVIKKH